MTISSGTRVGTTKVRTGCGNCKQRRKKCDETRDPDGRLACLKCSKSGRICLEVANTTATLRIVQYGMPVAVVQQRNARETQQEQCLKLLHSNLHPNPRMGCLGSEPSDVPPSKSTPEVQLAFNNLLSTHLMSLETIPRRAHLAMVINDPMLFETMIAFSKVSLRYYVAPSQRLTADIRSHIAKVLTQLGSRLATHDTQPPEALMLTVYYLFVVYQAAGDLEGCAIHFRGLQQLRGDQLNAALSSTNDVVCTSIASAELYSRYMASEGCPLNHNTTNAISHIAPALTHKRSTMSGVPPAFISLVMSGVLSSQGVRFLSNLELFLGQPYVSNAKNRMIVVLALKMIEAMQQSDYRICASKM